MYREFIRSMFIYLLLSGIACSLWAKPGREFYASDIRESMEKGDKLAILMVHFGSAYPEARTQVLDVMNKRVKEAFPDVEVRQAYSARSVVSRLRAQGIWIQQPAEALVELREQGFEVSIYPKALGENPDIRALFMDHIRFAMRYKRATIFERKKLYSH